MKSLTLHEIVNALAGRLLVPAKSCSIAGVSVDSRTIKSGELFFAIKGPRFDGHDYVGEALDRGAMYAVVSDSALFENTSAAERVIVVDDTVIALGQLAAYHRKQLSAAVIAITGSNGKTTTKAMVAEILSSKMTGRSAHNSYNNHIGVPLTLLSANACDDFLVVEAGTSAPGEINYLGSLIKPNIAVVTSVAPAHLEGLGSLEGIAREKLSLLGHICKGGLAVVNIDEPQTRQLLAQHESVNTVSVGLHPDSDIHVTQLTSNGQSVQFKLNRRFDVQLKVLGRHNALNAAAAFAVARRVGLEVHDIIPRLAQFELPNMRLQVQQHGSMMVINDCYNANPASMRAAIEALDNMQVPGRRVAIVGDMDELGTQSKALHEELGRIIAASDVDVLFSVGKFADIVCRSATNTFSRRLELHHSNGVDELTQTLRARLKAKDTILLKASRSLALETVLQAIPKN